MKKKQYTDEFKASVAEAASMPDRTIASVAREFGVNATLVRNWKKKFEGVGEMEGGDDFNLVWHIDRAKFVFDDPNEYEEWKETQKVFFELSPSQADDFGDAVFADPGEAEDDFEVTPNLGTISITLEDDGPLVSAWVKVKADLVEDVDAESLSDWSNDEGGWASCSIYLGPYDASIVEDDGGDWRLLDAEL